MDIIMRTTGRSIRLLAALLLFASGIALQGCREGEQDRILSYEKGKYLGKPDQKLSEAQREQLRQRAKAGQRY